MTDSMSRIETKLDEREKPAEDQSKRIDLLSHRFWGLVGILLVSLIPLAGYVLRNHF